MTEIKMPEPPEGMRWLIEDGTTGYIRVKLQKPVQVPRRTILGKLELKLLWRTVEWTAFHTSENRTAEENAKQAAQSASFVIKRLHRLGERPRDEFDMNGLIGATFGGKVHGS